MCSVSHRQLLYLEHQLKSDVVETEMHLPVNLIQCLCCRVSTRAAVGNDEHVKSTYNAPVML